MWTLLLDPATQGLALVLALCTLAYVAFDLRAGINAPSAASRFRAPRRRVEPRAKAAPRRAAPETAVEFWRGSDGELRGRVLAGPCRGRRLEDLSREECAAQLSYVQALDTALAARLDAYARRRFAPPPPRPEGELTRADALRELGLGEAASAADVHKAWRKLMQRHHPDHGGSHAKAARINQAKDVLAG